MELPIAFAERMAALLGNEYDAFCDALCNGESVKGLRVNTHKLSVGAFEADSPFALEKIPYVNGGYIVVMDDGDVLCYHSNDRESFRDYLYRNTFFEYVSTNKYVWSRIQKVDGEYFLPLNASVRFTTHTR